MSHSVIIAIIAGCFVVLLVFILVLAHSMDNLRERVDRLEEKARGMGYKL
jgi:uncharacterized membrane protein (DUF106 family)